MNLKSLFKYGGSRKTRRTRKSRRTRKGGNGGTRRV